MYSGCVVHGLYLLFVFFLNKIMRVTTLFRTADHLYWTKDPKYTVVRVGRNEAMTGESFWKTD